MVHQNRFRLSVLVCAVVSALLLAVLAVPGPGRALAATVTFTGAVDDDWHTAGNWDTNTVPVSTDDVVIPVGHSVVNSGAIVHTGTITNTGGFTNTGTIDNQGTFFNNGYFGNQGTFTNNNSIINTATLHNDDFGTFTNNGSITNSDDINNEGTFHNYGSVSGYVENFNTFYNYCTGTHDGIGPNDPIEVPCNAPPVCDSAVASPEFLWPPQHQLVEVSILGVGDPDGDPVSITIDSIYQDEPVNGTGDGDVAPDGFGVGTATASLRAERAGDGNGRVYTVAFTASDGSGSCSGTVTVGVNQDQGKFGGAVGDGALYDSTVP